MKTAQLAIIDHLTNGKAINFSSVKTIKAYAGELADAVKLAELHPAIFVWMREGNPLAVIAEYAVDLIVVSSSAVFAKDDNLTTNLELTESITSYLGNSFNFNYSGLPWTIDTEDLNVTTLMVNNKFAIVKISFSVRNLA